jgi:flagellar protein FliO/FliZ
MQVGLTHFIPTLAALAAVLGLIFAAARIVRNAGLGRRSLSTDTGGSTRLMVVDTLRLDRTRRLQVIRWEGRDLMLLTGGPGDHVIGWVSHGDNR